jgi:hypothetical protein
VQAVAGNGAELAVSKGEGNPLSFDFNLLQGLFAEFGGGTEFAP